MAKSFTRKKNNNSDLKITLDLAKNIPPQAVDVEASVLGAMLLDHSVVNRVIEMIVQDEIFYSDSNRKIYGAIKSLFAKGSPIDVLTLLEELRKREELDEVGGPGVLTELTNNIASAANVEYHCKILIEKYMLRELIKSSMEIASKCYEGVDDTFEILDDAERKIFDISENKFKRTYKPLNLAIKSTIELIEKARKSEFSGLRTGYFKFDELTGGFQDSDLIIIAARPGIGKTALAISIARNMALENQIPVGFFSLEMTTHQIVLRLLSGESRISMSRLRSRVLEHEEDKKVTSAFHKLSNAKIYIDDTPALSILELRAKTRRLIAEHGVKIIFVDYLQLMQGPSNSETREREISYISRSLKSLAKETNIPVIALAQLNRQVEGRQSKRPLLSDLRESGAIEQDSDVVCFIHRADKYMDQEKIDPSEKNIAEIIIAKQRNGPTASFELVFHEQATRFENPETDRVMEIYSTEVETPF